MLIYLDSNVVIYLIEQPPGWGSTTTARINALRANGDRIMVSDLVRMECRIQPLALGDVAALADFDDFFASTDVQVVGMTATVFDRAAHIRASYRFRALDALHLAAALEHGGDRILTNDARLSRFIDLTVEVLQ